LLVVVLAVSGFVTAGCAKQSLQAPVKPTAASRLNAICEQADHELATIDRHKIQPYPQVFGRFIEEAAEESQKVDQTTVTDVRRLPVSPRKGLALTDLARTQAELRAIVRALQRHGPSFRDLPHGVLLRFLEANSGCGQVKVTKPIAVKA
jgi:hypothetical protein